jgi:hypothetical protein
MTFHTIQDVRRHNCRQGFHFFDADTLSFFSSRIGGRLYGGRYFVTSEQGPNGIRAYTIRYANDDGTITTVGDFQSHDTRSQAIAAVRRLVAS